MLHVTQWKKQGLCTEISLWTPVLAGIFWVRDLSSISLHISSTAKRGEPPLPHRVVTKRLVWTQEKHTTWRTYCRCSTPQERAGLGFLTNLFFSPALRTGLYRSRSPAPDLFCRGARESFPCLLPFTEPVLEFSYLHNDNTQSKVWESWVPLGLSEPTQQCSSGWQGSAEPPAKLFSGTGTLRKMQGPRFLMTRILESVDTTYTPMK